MFIINCLFFVFVIIHNLFGAYSDAFTLFSNRFNVRSDIIFEMYTKSNGSDKLTLSELDRENGRAARSILNRNFAFDYRRPTRIFIHGFLSKRDTLDMYLDAYLAAGDFNLIVVNWLKGAVTLSYSRARNRVKLVGEAVAEFIDYLVMEEGMDPDDLLLVGHSLGAHACGAAGRSVKFGRVSKIIGLDPALPCFGHRHRDERLNQTDADYVMVIHTNGGVFGLEPPLGHADFYPNFGKDQPGCGRTIVGDICSHQRVHEYFLESLTPSSKFMAKPCISYHEIYENRCTQSGPMEMMKGEFDEKPMGVFHLSTNQVSPFAKDDQ